MPEVHATAVVSREAELDSDVRVGPHVVIEGPVRLARGVEIVSHAYLCGETAIGADTVIHPFVAIGGPPQDYRHQGERSFCRIGARNQIREGVTVHRGTVEDSATVIGNDNMLMANVHVGHNVHIGDHAVVTNSVMLAGYASVGDHAVLGGGAGIHQFVRVGAFAMVSGLSRITRDLLPFMIYAERDECIGVNRIGLRRNGYGHEVVTELRGLLRTLRSVGDPRATARQLESTVVSNAAREVLAFVLADSKRGVALRGRGSRDDDAAD
jgi:UDP-N-acetylglucosamine acyltransferase